MELGGVNENWATRGLLICLLTACRRGGAVRRDVFGRVHKISIFVQVAIIESSPHPTMRTSALCSARCFGRQRSGRVF